jgi:hypothetical protein
MRIPLRGAVAVLTAGAAIAVAGTAAQAQTDPPTTRPVPVDVSKPSPVAIQLDVLDAKGRVVEHDECSWVYAPEDDDRECLRFQGDPQDAIAKITGAGGVRVLKRLQAPTKGIDTTQRIARNADGVWVFRTTGTVDGKPWRYVHTWDPARD